MIEYKFILEDGTEYLPNGATISTIAKKTFAQGPDNFSWENKIVDNSFLPGAQKLGVTRLQSSQIGFTLTRTNPDTAAYRSETNDIISAFEATKYVVDITQGLRIEVAPLSYGVGTLPGAEKHMSMDEMTFEKLTPWEDETVKVQNETLTGGTFNEINVNNAGYMEAIPIFTFTASTAVNNIQIITPDNDNTFQIQDSLFGTVGFETLIIDNELGTAKIGDIDRSNFVVPGTGFIRIPVGAAALVRIFVSAACTVKIEWRNRVYV